MQGLVGGSNDVEKVQPIGSLYLGRKDKGSGYLVFKIDTKYVYQWTK